MLAPGRTLPADSPLQSGLIFSMARKTKSAGPPPRKDEFTAHVETFMERVDRFWQRVTDGMRLSQLWSQFQTDARSSYRLYSHEVDSSRVAGVPRRKHFFNLVSQFFWAILLKLTPARRVLLLIALVLLCLPSGDAAWQSSNGQAKFIVLDNHFWGGVLLLVLLILEVADRVVMKRDLQIAKEIRWRSPLPRVRPTLSLEITTTCSLVRVLHRKTKPFCWRLQTWLARAFPQPC
jgi:hypothetical protein